MASPCTDLDPYTLPELLAALGGRLTLYTGSVLVACPSCQAEWAELAADGTRHICRRCTVAEVGEPLDELAQRITAGKTLAQWRKMARDEDGRVIFTPRAKR